MIRIEAVLTNRRQAEAYKAFLDAYFDDQDKRDVEADKKVAERKPAEPPVVIEASALTPLEQAIDAANPPAAAEEATDPFAAITAAAEPAPEPKKRGRPKKGEAIAQATQEPKQAESEKPAEDKPLTLDDIRKASSIVLENLGAPVVTEALAKFHAVDDKQALRMSALDQARYPQYIEFLKKKMNDAAKAWPE